MAEAALLLDLDGTLLDMAPTPDAVVVEAGLADALGQLRGLLGGALAVVTGRPADQVDALLPGVIPVVSGEHGGALRPAPGAALIRNPLPDLPPGLIERAQALADAHPGVVLERKQRGFVFHYRPAPEAGPLVHAALLPMIDAVATLQVTPAHMAWEVRPRGADKGGAVRQVMALPGFVGRRPIFIGDDVTDRDGIAAAESLGGAGLFVPDVFGSAGAVRAWLSGSAAAGRWTQPS